MPHFLLIRGWRDLKHDICTRVYSIMHIYARVRIVYDKSYRADRPKRRRRCKTPEREMDLLGGVQPFSRDLKDKDNFAMLDEIRIANKENVFLKFIQHGDEYVTCTPRIEPCSAPNINLSQLNMHLPLQIGFLKKIPKLTIC